MNSQHRDTEGSAGLRRFLLDLKRRKVYRAIAVYVVVAYVSLEVVNLLIPATTLPVWADELLLAIAIVGLPIVAVLAWIFEITPDGVKVTAPAGAAPGELSRRQAGGWLWAGVTILTAFAALGWYLVAGGKSGTTDRTIAVLPFEALGPAESTAFSEGIHAGVLTRLSSLSGLDVISRTSVMRYREPGRSLPQIAAELGAGWVVVGEVQEVSDQVQVIARLINAGTDRQIWAEEYQRELSAENVFSIQSDITRQIARALKARLSAEELQQVDRMPTRDLAAYELYLEGRSLLGQRTEVAMRRAEDYFKQAIDQDPAFTIAYVGLADSLMLRISYGHGHGGDAVNRARSALQRAIELDPTLGEAHASLALVYLYTDRQQGPAALRELERAIELRPNYADAFIWQCWTQLLLGQPEKALDSSRRAVELNPLSVEAGGNLASALQANRDYELALAESRRVLDIQRGWQSALLGQGLLLYELGRLQEAEAALAGVSVAWAAPAARDTLALVHIASGNDRRGRELLAEAEAEGQWFSIALINAAMGEKELAIGALEQIDDWDDWSTLALRYFYPDVWATIKDDPRFGAVIRRLDHAWGVGADQKKL